MAPIAAMVISIPTANNVEIPNARLVVILLWPLIKPTIKGRLAKWQGLNKMLKTPHIKDANIAINHPPSTACVNSLNNSAIICPSVIVIPISDDFTRCLVAQPCQEICYVLCDWELSYAMGLFGGCVSVHKVVVQFFPLGQNIFFGEETCVAEQFFAIRGEKNLRGNGSDFVFFGYALIFPDVYKIHFQLARVFLAQFVQYWRHHLASHTFIRTQIQQTRQGLLSGGRGFGFTGLNFLVIGFCGS